MAKIKMSPLATDIAGSVDGLLFSKSRGINTVRTKVVPVNPNTAAQRVKRRQMAQMMSLYNLLGLPFRNVWDAASVGVTLPPIQLYLQAVLGAYYAASPFSASPKTSLPDVSVVQGTWAPDTDPVQVVFSPSPVPAGLGFLIKGFVPNDEDNHKVLVSQAIVSAGNSSPGYITLPDISGGDPFVCGNFYDAAAAIVGYGSSFLVEFT